MNSYDFDTVLFPVNWCYWLNRKAGPEVIEKAQEKNMGIIATKSLAHRNWKDDENEDKYPNCWYKPIYDNPDLAAMALKFTLKQPVSVALSPGDVRMLRLGLDIIEDKQEIELSDREYRELEKLAQDTDPIFDHNA